MYLDHCEFIIFQPKKGYLFVFRKICLGYFLDHSFIKTPIGDMLETTVQSHFIPLKEKYKYNLIFWNI